MFAKYVVKIGTSYVAADGSLVSSQSSAAQIMVSGNAPMRRVTDDKPRLVKVRPHGSAPGTMHD